MANIFSRLLPQHRRIHPYKSTITEAALGVEIPLSAIPNNTRVFGYYGNLAYIQGISDILCKELTCALSPHNDALKQRIQATPNATFIHIRRGDYLRLWEYVELGKAYYECAINHLISTLKHVHFFIFSNDIPWCKKHFLSLLDATCVQKASFEFIEHNDEAHATQELMLMRSCQHAITANSTFSWWGAFLINNPKKIVIMPSLHLYNEPNCSKNIMPQEWIVLHPTWGNNIRDTQSNT